MEGCAIHLATHDPIKKRELEIDKKKTFDDIYLVEEPAGTYHGLEAGNKHQSINQSITSRGSSV